MLNITDLLLLTAAIDDSLDKGLCDWLERIGAGKACGQKIHINFGEYPLFKFKPEFLQDANPERYVLVFHD